MAVLTVAPVKEPRMAVRRRVVTMVVPMAAQTVERAARAPGVGEYGAGSRAAAG
ncbi:hypothetical protein AB0L70_04095 [Kribbella sp. NPDC051952]|uniref:hypothetical protein n=1 Tax=Kribbella sp. NPDC051952 TaxID=3154851 RepID=UPI00344831C3